LIVKKYTCDNLFSELIHQLKKTKIRFPVSGISMLPFIRDNYDSVLLSQYKTQNLRVGDIILFIYSDNLKKLCLHRIIKLDGKIIITMGDSCTCYDNPIIREQIIAIVEKIYRGKLTINCDSKFWRAIFFIWLYLLPIRRTLIRLYYCIAKNKSKICRWKDDCIST